MGSLVRGHNLSAGCNSGEWEGINSLWNPFWNLHLFTCVPTRLVKCQNNLLVFTNLGMVQKQPFLGNKAGKS